MKAELKDGVLELTIEPGDKIGNLHTYAGAAATFAMRLMPEELKKLSTANLACSTYRGHRTCIRVFLPSWEKDKHWTCPCCGTEYHARIADVFGTHNKNEERRWYEVL